jgi:hypothetical protein
MQRDYKRELEGIEELISDTLRKIKIDNDEDQVYFLKGLMKMKSERLNLLNKQEPEIV